MNKNLKLSNTSQNDLESVCIVIRSVPAKFGLPRMFRSAVDESINLEHGDIVVLAVFECWEASTLFSKIDITVS